jgi:hypothetical protein
LFGETEAAAADVVANNSTQLQQQHQPTLRSFFLPIINHQNSLQREELENSNIANMQIYAKQTSGKLQNPTSSCIIQTTVTDKTPWQVLL